MHTEPIYHITSSAQWELAKVKGYYEADSIAKEGFIHCSTAKQVAGVLERYYLGRTDLVKLTINPEKLAYPLKFDFADSVNEYFPHIYGTLNLSAVEKIEFI
ncbi:MAG: DUF952 domain-containing protein [Sediminibacterium sp.]|jgi:uncharacterized protein (DUF952 family)|nr:DUF952 domain-containing protein [Chitinophagaceae bacterium]MCA6445828.1 DUF952 domain-containing protein [Chitinophagaceae bacterium]